MPNYLLAGRTSKRCEVSLVEADTAIREELKPSFFSEEHTYIYLYIAFFPIYDPFPQVLVRKHGKGSLAVLGSVCVFFLVLYIS